MKKFYLIPLMTLMCSVMAWGSEIVVNDFATLKTQLSASGTADVVKLANDIAYSGTEVLNIERSLTLDGQGHKITGYGQLNTKVNYSDATNYNAVIAVNYQGNVASTLEVTIQNLYIGSTVNARHYGVIAFDGVKSLLLQNDSIVYTRNTTQPICVNGYQSSALELTINNSYIKAGPKGYCAYILKPIDATVTNSTIDGWAGFYFKPCNSTGNYGNNIGSRGSKLTATATTFNCPNIHSEASNNFALFPLEEDGIEISLHNCTFNAETKGTTPQRFLNMQYQVRTSGFQPVKIKLTGDNTHLYNVVVDQVVFNGWAVGKADPNIGTTPDRALINVPFTFTIEAGTYSFDPSAVRWYQYGDEVTGNLSEQMDGTGKITIDDTKYEVKEVSQGGDIVYRVVKKAARDGEEKLYNLNDNVETAGNGQNPATSFDLKTGTDMTLNQATTKAGYVEVSNGTTVTVATDQTLVINNGLDVQGTSVVTAKPGSALVIGEGGIVTSKPENIVIEADENGAASLLLDPTITVNQTPELTVKMTVPAEHAGYDMHEAEQYRHWFRFAMPVQHMAAIWAKEPNVPTYLYGWDYANQKWSQVGVTEMVPFAGYTLSPDRLITNETGTITYTFKGQLLGNTDCKLELNHHGYNFFGNSYTGYISILKLVDQIMGDAKIDGTVWMWDGEKYEGIGLEYLRQYGAIEPSWKKEVAPMQTFVLRLTGDDFSSTDINYADAIWGNPRYDNAKSALNAAPARHAVMNDDAIIRMTIEANGQKESVVMIENSNYSDAYDRGYDAIKYMNENCFNTYVSINGEDYGTVATDNLEGKMLNIKTNNELAYALTFEFVAGEEYALRDNATNQVIAIEEGATYEFAAQPNSTIEGRFEIVSVAKMPTAIENTEVKVNVKGIYTLTGQYLGENFEALPAGVYVVNGVKIVK